MNKITEEQLLEYISEVGLLEKEHRKYSSFYCWVSHTITQEDVKILAEEGVDASDFLNVCVSRNGMWDDSYGAEWDDATYEKVEEYQELVPEVVIHEHYVTKTRTQEFKPTWN